MQITTATKVGHYDGRQVQYAELVISGNLHTLSARKYPKNTILKMWRNNSSRDAVTYKVPNGKFIFPEHVKQIITDFDAVLDDTHIEIAYAKWKNITGMLNF